MGPDINMKDFKVLNFKAETISVFKVSDPTLISVRKAVSIVLWGFFSDQVLFGPSETTSVCSLILLISVKCVVDFEAGILN